MNKIKLGIIGYGNMGSSHVKNITDGKTPKVELTAVCDINPKRIEVFKEKHSDIATFSNAEDMYKSGLVDSVLIAVPHYDHPPLAIKAFEYGLNVLTEKPAGVYTKQVLEMNAAAEKSGKVFGIMYNQRTNPMYAKIKELVESGELGAVKRVSWIITDWYRGQCYHDSATWRSAWATEGGGTLINQNPHQLDLWQWMFGMPDRIMSHCSFGKYYNIEVEDDVTAFFEYNNGMTGTYITSTGEAPGTNRLEVACDMGRIIAENDKLIFDRNCISEREFNKINTKPFGRPECWHCEIPVDSKNSPQHVGIMNDFAAVVLGEKEKLLAPGVEGVRGLTISNAIHYSAWTEKWADCNNFPHEEFYNLLQEKIKNSKFVKKNVVEQTVDLDGTY